MSWIHAHSVWVLAGLLFLVAGWLFWSGCRDLEQDEKEVKRITMEVDDGH